MLEDTISGTTLGGMMLMGSEKQIGGGGGKERKDKRMRGRRQWASCGSIGWRQ